LGANEVDGCGNFHRFSVNLKELTAEPSVGFYLVAIAINWAFGYTEKFISDTYHA